MKERRNHIVKALAAALLVTAAAGSAAGTVKADWSISHYTDENGYANENIYLLDRYAGIARGQNGTTADAGMNVYMEKGLFSFQLYTPGQQEPVSHNPNENGIYTVPGTVTLEDMGLRQEVTFVYSPDSKEYTIDSADTISGSTRNGEPITVNDGVLMELYNAGTVDLTLSYTGWVGDLAGIPTVLEFSLRQNTADFRSLYETAADNGWMMAVQNNEPARETEEEAPAVTSSRYSNNEIERICRNYQISLNNALPYAEALAESLACGDYLTAFAGGVFGLDSFESFLAAWNEFDGLVYEDMTNEQQTYYSQVKSAVNSSMLGEVFYVIQELRNYGIL